jgi:hypothetical protein
VRAPPSGSGATRGVEPRLRPSLPCQRGSHPALRFTYRGHVSLPITSRSMTPVTTAMGCLSASLAPLSDAGEPCSGPTSALQRFTPSLLVSSSVWRYYTTAINRSRPVLTCSGSLVCLSMTVPHAGPPLFSLLASAGFAAQFLALVGSLGSRLAVLFPSSPIVYCWMTIQRFARRWPWAPPQPVVWGGGVSPNLRERTQLVVFLDSSWTPLAGAHVILARGPARGAVTHRCLPRDIVAVLGGTWLDHLSPPWFQLSPQHGMQWVSDASPPPLPLH